MVTKLTIISSILFVFLSLPLWMYVLYWILHTINAPTHVWFAFWIYVPVTTIMAVISRIVNTSN